ncbi:MAG TPA: hypothetical protein VMK12_02895 [Anaeromyxobacteraceae bacterium]|nr:hypothetical protein [Anaeromyxobacteraceae bacterium]
MELPSPELIAREVGALIGELALERFRHVAGIEKVPRLVEVFGAHSRAAHKGVVVALESQGEKELAARVAVLRTERVQAADEEAWRAAETAASVLGPDGLVPLSTAQLAVANERDRGRRRALGTATAEAARLPAREAAAEKRAQARAEVGLVPDWDGVVEADALLAVSEDAYRDVLAFDARREGVSSEPAPRGDLSRADLLYVLALHRFAGLFPRGMLFLVLQRTAAALRLDLGRIGVEEGNRPEQWPGAHAFETRVSFRRQGGACDWLGLFRAAGQALAAASLPPASRPSHAMFTMGELFAALLVDRGFLVARLGADKREVADLSRSLALRLLFEMRTRAAALRFATEVDRGMSGEAWCEAHRETMGLAALASWPRGLAARDCDSSRHAGALRGAARAEILRRALVERCDEDWWKNPRSADLLASWFAADGDRGGEEPKLAPVVGALVAKMQ